MVIDSCQGHPRKCHYRDHAMVTIDAFAICGTGTRAPMQGNGGERQNDGAIGCSGGPVALTDTFRGIQCHRMRRKTRREVAERRLSLQERCRVQMLRTRPTDHVQYVKSQVVPYELLLLINFLVFNLCFLK